MAVAVAVAVAVNNAVRRIFGFRYWQSIRHIREVYGFQSIEQMFSNAKTKFLRKMTVHSNGILRFLSSLEPAVVELLLGVCYAWIVALMLTNIDTIITLP